MQMVSAFVAVHRDPAGVARAFRQRDEVTAAFRSGVGVTWLHLTGITRDDIPFLEGELGLHPLAVEDSLNSNYQRPKVDDFGAYLFLLLHGIDYGRTDETVTTGELDLFVGPHFVVSTSLEPVPALTLLAEQMALEPDLLPANTALLAYTVIDALVDGILPVVDRMEEVTDVIEDGALSNPNPALLEHLIRLKRSVMRMERVISPQRQMLHDISRGSYPLLNNGNELFFRDVFDHLLRLEDMISTLHDRADHAVSTYHSALSIRQNETMRVLAIVASIFLPLTLLAGIYGMNFEHMPELGWEYGYFVVVGFMLVVVAIGTYFLFGRALLGWSRDRVGHLVSFALEPPVLSEAIREASRLRTRVLDEAARLTRRDTQHDPPSELPHDRDPAP